MYVCVLTSTTPSTRGISSIPRDPRCFASSIVKWSGTATFHPSLRDAARQRSLPCPRSDGNKRDRSRRYRSTPATVTRRRCRFFPAKIRAAVARACGRVSGTRTTGKIAASPAWQCVTLRRSPATCSNQNQWRRRSRPLCGRDSRETDVEKCETVVVHSLGPSKATAATRTHAGGEVIPATPHVFRQRVCLPAPTNCTRPRAIKSKCYQMLSCLTLPLEYLTTF